MVTLCLIDRSSLMRSAALSVSSTAAFLGKRLAVRRALSELITIDLLR